MGTKPPHVYKAKRRRRKIPNSRRRRKSKIIPTRPCLKRLRSWRRKYQNSWPRSPRQNIRFNRLHWRSEKRIWTHARSIQIRCPTTRRNRTRNRPSNHGITRRTINKRSNRISKKQRRKRRNNGRPITSWSRPIKRRPHKNRHR